MPPKLERLKVVMSVGPCVGPRLASVLSEEIKGRADLWLLQVLLPTAWSESDRVCPCLLV